MKNSGPVDSGSAILDARIRELGDWRGKTLAKVRAIIHEADPEIVEEWKWVKPTSPGTPVFSHGGIVCTGETYKNVVKMTFAKGAALKDPSRLFNSSLEGNVRRAIDIHEGDKIYEPALKDLIRAAVALNLKDKNKLKTKTRRPTRKSDGYLHRRSSSCSSEELRYPAPYAKQFGVEGPRSPRRNSQVRNVRLIGRHSSILVDPFSPLHQ